MFDRHSADDTVALPNDPPQPLSAPLSRRTVFCHGLDLSIPSTRRIRYNALPLRTADDEILCGVTDDWRYREFGNFHQWKPEYQGRGVSLDSQRDRIDRDRHSHEPPHRPKRRDCEGRWASVDWRCQIDRRNCGEDRLTETGCPQFAERSQSGN